MTDATYPLASFSAEQLGGGTKSLAGYAGQVLLIVNTASRCGFTPQYAGLQALYQQFCARGFCVLGFPCNQFGAQEPGAPEEIAQFCTRDYGVTFPMFAKVDVNGEHAHPLFAHLKNAAPGLLGSTAIKWNFTKFLVGRDGHAIRRYAPMDTPEKIAADIEKQL